MTQPKLDQIPANVYAIFNRDGVFLWFADRPADDGLRYYQSVPLRISLPA